MVNITKETYENNDIETIVDSIGKLWLNEKNIEEELGHKTICRYELLNEPKYQPSRRLLRSDLPSKVIMGCRTDESCNNKRSLGFKLHDIINTKEQTALESIKNTSEGEDIQTQYSVLVYRFDLYFHK